MGTRINKILTMDKFINEALYNKKLGYYMKRNRFGAKGDFITSPNISILFSEMIAIWTISFWENLGCPKKFNLIELGGGNGEMIKQMLRTTWDGLKTAQQNAQFLTNQARISGEFLELARQERQAGNRTLLDVLGGETALINAQADAIAAKIEVLINSYTLLSLMGGLDLDSIELVEKE